jgi:DNA repair exonuclease SbcCD ATPase subunit
MSKINFKYLIIEGFRSIVKPFLFDLNKPGLNLLKGINGAGKTSTFEALIWAIYGVNLKEVNQDQVITWPENRTSQWQGTRVSVTFDIGSYCYEIIRHLNYKGLTQEVKGEDYLMLLKDGKMLGDYRNKKEMQEAINQLLGLDARTFTNSILFGQRMAKLIQQDNKDKRELFETLFETEWVANCKLKADADIKTWESDLLKLGWDITKFSTEIEHLTDKLSTAKETLASFEETRANRILTKQGELDEYTVKLGELEAELVLYQEQLAAVKYDAVAHDTLNNQFETLEKQFNEANLVQVAHAGKLNSANNLLLSKKSEYQRVSAEHLQLTEKHIESNCPYCEQELKAGNKLEINHNKDIAAAWEKVGVATLAVKEAEKALKALQKVKAPATPESITKAKEAIEEQLVAMDELLTKHEDTLLNIKDINAEIIQAKKDILRVNNEIGAIKAEKAPDVNTKSIETRIGVEKLNLETLQQEKPVIEKKLEIAKWWSSKALGAGGVKAYVFTSMLSTLNQCVKKYGDRLGASLEFSIDLTKASKPFTTRCTLGDRIDKDYNSFSGGEKDRLDIVLMFAMYDLISISTEINLLIMDEPFSGLDEEGEGIVFELIREKAETGKSVFVITHSATLDSLYANKIEFNKVNGDTTKSN